MNILLDRGRTSVGLSAHHLPRCQTSWLAHRPSTRSGRPVRPAAAGTLKLYSKVLEYEYRVKTAVLGTLK
jgi:hypothetical protein